MMSRRTRSKKTRVETKRNSHPIQVYPTPAMIPARVSYPFLSDIRTRSGAGTITSTKSAAPMRLRPRIRKAVRAFKSAYR